MKILVGLIGVTLVSLNILLAIAYDFISKTPAEMEWLESFYED